MPSRAMPTNVGLRNIETEKISSVFPTNGEVNSVMTALYGGSLDPPYGVDGRGVSLVDWIIRSARASENNIFIFLLLFFAIPTVNLRWLRA